MASSLLLQAVVLLAFSQVATVVMEARQPEPSLTNPLELQSTRRAISTLQTMRTAAFGKSTPMASLLPSPVMVRLAIEEMRVLPPAPNSTFQFRLLSMQRGTFISATGGMLAFAR